MALWQVSVTIRPSLSHVVLVAVVGSVATAYRFFGNVVRRSVIPLSYTNLSAAVAARERPGTELSPDARDLEQ